MTICTQRATQLAHRFSWRPVSCRLLPVRLGTELSVITGATWRHVAGIVVALASLNLFYHVHTMMSGSRSNMMRKQKAEQAQRQQRAAKELIQLCIQV
jgi:hypothetical protein